MSRGSRLHFPVSPAEALGITVVVVPLLCQLVQLHGRMSEVQLPPIRTLDDFALGSARLAAPDPCDPQRWCHRVINNLLYYQTNYLLCFIFSLALTG